MFGFHLFSFERQLVLRESAMIGFALALAAPHTPTTLT
jgi:hypothetical protein